MRKSLCLLLILIVCLQVGAQKKELKLGVSLWTFHTVDFPASLQLADSTGLKYIEPNTFHGAGAEFKDSSIGKLSSEGLQKIKKLIDGHGLEATSIYIAGGGTIDSWKKEFEVAKQLGVKFVTTEPPVTMWDSIDSLAGIYGLKVAIHDHWKGTSAYWHPDSVLAAIKGHKNFGACADIGHWPKSGIEPVEAIKKLKGHILGVHLKDIAAFNDPSLKDVTPGTGVINIPGVLAELKKQKFNGFIYIEQDKEDLPNNLPSVMSAIEYFNSINK